MKNKIFRCVTTLLVLALVACNYTAFAADADTLTINVELLSDSNLLKISGDATADRIVTLVILKDSGAVPYVLGDVTEGNASDIIYAVKQTKTNSEGKYDFLVYWDALQDGGRFQFKVAETGRLMDENERTVSYFLSSNALVNAALTGVNAADVSTMKTALENEALASYLNLSDYDENLELVNQKLINARVAAGGNFTSAPQLARRLNEAVLFSLMQKNVLTADKLESYGNPSGEIFNEDYQKLVFSTDYTLLKQSVIEVMNNNVDVEVNSIAEAQTFLDTAVAITAFNNSPRSSLISVIDKYDSILKIKEMVQYSKYSTLSEADRVQANASLVNQGFNTVAEIQSTFKYVMDNFVSNSQIIVDIPSNNSGFGGGGNRGGFSGGGNKTTSSAVTIAKQSTETDKSVTDLYEPIFNDIENVAWAKEAIEIFYENKYINGTSEKTFSPDKYVTREEFTKIVVNILGLFDENAEYEFSDVSADDWWYPYVSSAAKAGIITGISESKFGTGNSISRQDASVIIVRAAVLKGIEFSDDEDIDFADDNEISDYAKESVYVLRENNIVNGRGDNVFAPNDGLTRAEAVVILHRLWELL